jgi:hypothetical protein
MTSMLGCIQAAGICWGVSGRKARSPRFDATSTDSKVKHTLVSVARLGHFYERTEPSLGLGVSFS